jgi:low molecular weight phosphotyrosine protein phosphatase
MAEAVFREQIDHPSNPAFSEIDSAGTGAYHTGSTPDSRTMRTLKANGVNRYKHAARKVATEDFEKFDWIFAMDAENLENLESLRDRVRRKQGKKEGDGKTANIMLFGEFGGKRGEQIDDPYYGGDNGFDIVYEQCVRFSKGFLKHLGGETADKK